MRIIDMFHPGGKFYSFEVQHGRDISIYETVEVFKKKSNPEFVNKEIDTIMLRDIINLHNKDGIQSLERIKSMIKDIGSGKDILSSDGFPNIKLVKSENDNWVLFDGHHTMLAYMAAGKQFLHEVPHIIVRNRDEEFANSDEISVFFGGQSDKIKNWKELVINWQAPKEKQLCRRIQNNMGELFEAFKQIL